MTSHGTTLHKPKLRTGRLPPQRLRRVLDFMDANLDRQVGLGDLAAQAGLSSSHFCHQFRVSTSASPHKYMLALRIDRGNQMLRDPKLSVLEVALAVGFENQQHFATAFRRVAGVSPSDYRRHL
jgi:AraC family transcriptional regulator